MKTANKFYNSGFWFCLDTRIIWNIINLQNIKRCNLREGAVIIHLLFICSQNKRRSLTAEKIFQGLDEHSVRSAGTESNARVKVTAGMLGWADIIFCMEKKHVRRLKERYADALEGKRVVCFNISDDYNFMDENLIDLLESCLYDYL